MEMKKMLRTFMLSACMLLTSASFIFADIAPLPEPGPEPQKSRAGILVVLAIVIIALFVVRALIRKKRGK